MKKIFSILFCIFALVTFLSAQQMQKSLQANRTFIAPIIDGYGNDEAWNTANTASDFIQRDPIEGNSPSEKTEVKILFDDKNLYIFAMMYDSSPDSIVARLARRDDEVESDYISIRIDSYYDKQTAFEFTINASGSKTDILQYDDGAKEDASWDPVWEVETKIVSAGWTAELQIPLSQLRFVEGNDVWGINFIRFISRKQERIFWSLAPKSQSGFISFFGTLTGMREIKLPTLFEALPYAVASSEHYPRKERKDKIEKLRPNVGIDIKYGLSTNFTIDATFNPDFAQVEADPAVLNLTTFETFYPEKRPFFIEGTQILRFVTFGGQFGPGLFYSRRIGKTISPRLPSDGAAITDEPHNATILTAVKLTGKTSDGLSIGVMNAITQEEQFSYRDTLGIIRTQRAEPIANYSVVRMKQDFWGNSNIGGIVTATAKESRTPAFTAGMDWKIKFFENNYQLDGFLAGSKIRFVSGEPREGSAGRITFAKVSGEHWLYSVNTDFTSKKYYINDIGFFNSPNDYGGAVSLSYRELTPGEIFRNYRFGLRNHLRWNFDRLTLFRELTFSSSAQFLNYWVIEGDVNFGLPAKDPYEPRGYGVYTYPSYIQLRGEIETDSRKFIIINLEQSYRVNSNNGIQSNTSASLILHPSTTMDYKFTGGYSLSRNIDSFADTVQILSSPFALFGERDVDGLDLTLRGSILFTKDLSLQLYNQFFSAKGHYDNFSTLQTNGTLQPYMFYTRNADFNRTSFISNIVLRWEYREGSTLYFVWSHGRRFVDALQRYSTTLDENFTQTFSTAPDNVYAVKISYWWNL